MENYKKRLIELGLHGSKTRELDWKTWGLVEDISNIKQSMGLFFCTVGSLRHVSPRKALSLIHVDQRKKKTHLRIHEEPELLTSRALGHA